MFHLLEGECLHKLCDLFLKYFDSSAWEICYIYLSIHHVSIDLYQYGVIGIYFIFWVIIQNYCTHLLLFWLFGALSLGFYVPTFDVSPSFCVCVLALSCFLTL